MLAVSLSKSAQERKPTKRGREPKYKVREAHHLFLLLPLNYISCTLLGNSVRNKTG